MLTVHGIRNCDTVKKALAWLDANGADYAFHDYKKAGVDEAQLRRWVAALGWEAVLNRNGQTFRKLDAAATRDLDEAKAVALMLAHPSAIRRPIVTGRAQPVVGFKPEQYAAAFAGAAKP
jgi:arsenate reductase